MGNDAVIDGILDTSVLIAGVADTLGEREGVYAISVISLAELHRGAVGARSARQRSTRTARLALVESTYLALPVDRRVAIKYGELSARTHHLSNRPHVIDGIIAATALVHRVPVLTYDDDFDRIPDLDVVKL
jgi:predicted nucleic acid-binding protein